MSSVASILDVRPTTGLLKALADDTRLRMVALLAHGELCVCHLTAALDLNQPNASQHLTVLRNAGVVECRRRANWVWYQLAEQGDPARRRVLDAVVASFEGQELLAGDAAKLRAVRTTTSCA